MKTQPAGGSSSGRFFALHFSTRRSVTRSATTAMQPGT